MIDKIEMRSKDRLDITKLSNIFQSHQIVRVPDTLYRSCTIIKKDSKELITFKTNPVWGEVHQSKIIINPSKWQSYQSLITSLSTICDPSTLEITRIDHAVDILIPFEQLYSGLQVKHKKSQELYKESCSIRGKFLTGCTFGQKPELYCIYDKGYQLTSRKLRLNNDFKLGVLTRIELRQFGKRVRYKHLSELTNYLSNLPFYGLEYYTINSNSSKAHSLAVLMNHDGLQRVRATLNNKNNFDRNYKKLLSQNDLQNTINYKYRDELSLFLGEN